MRDSDGERSQEPCAHPAWMNGVGGNVLGNVFFLNKKDDLRDIVAIYDQMIFMVYQLWGIQKLADSFTAFIFITHVGWKFCVTHTHTNIRCCYRRARLLSPLVLWLLWVMSWKCPLSSWNCSSINNFIQGLFVFPSHQFYAKCAEGERVFAVCLSHYNHI